MGWADGKRTVVSHCRVYAGEHSRRGTHFGTTCCPLRPFSADRRSSAPNGRRNPCTNLPHTSCTPAALRAPHARAHARTKHTHAQSTHVNISSRWGVGLEGAHSKRTLAESRGMGGGWRGGGGLLSCAATAPRSQAPESSRIILPQPSVAPSSCTSTLVLSAPTLKVSCHSATDY